MEQISNEMNYPRFEILNDKVLKILPNEEKEIVPYTKKVHDELQQELYRAYVENINERKGLKKEKRSTITTTTSFLLLIIANIISSLGLSSIIMVILSIFNILVVTSEYNNKKRKVNNVFQMIERNRLKLEKNLPFEDEKEIVEEIKEEIVEEEKFAFNYAQKKEMSLIFHLLPEDIAKLEAFAIGNQMDYYELMSYYKDYLNSPIIPSEALNENEFYEFIEVKRLEKKL